MALETAHPNYIKAQAVTAMTLAQPNPPVWNTKEEAERMSSLMGNINTFQQEWLVKFATGNESLDKWDWYVEEMKKLGVDEVMDLANKGYQRYLDSVGKSKGYVPPLGVDISGLARMVGL